MEKHEQKSFVTSFFFFSEKWNVTTSVERQKCAFKKRVEFNASARLNFKSGSEPLNAEDNKQRVLRASSDARAKPSIKEGGPSTAAHRGAAEAFF